MSDISTLGWIAIATVILLELLTTVVFLYQRTLRKLAYKLGVDQKILVFLYPLYMLLSYQISFLKWPLYIYLLFVNWIVAVGIFISTFVLTMILPVIDWRHLLTMRKMLKKCYSDYYINISRNFKQSVTSLFGPCPVYIENYETILEAIDDGLIQTGYEVQNLEEYKAVKEFGMLSDQALVMLLVAEKHLFHYGPQASIHIAQIRKRLALPCDTQREDLESLDRGESISEAEDKDLQTGDVDLDEDVPPWCYERECYFEVNIEDHNTTPEENRYLAILRYLYNQKMGLFEEMLKTTKDLVYYDWKTFCWVCFSALMSAALMDKEYRLFLEYQVHKPFACAMKRLDANLYKIFDALFFYVRRKRQENIDEHKDLFESTRDLFWSDKPLDCIVSYIGNWLFQDEETEGTRLAIKKFRDCVPGFIVMFDKHCADV